MLERYPCLTPRIPSREPPHHRGRRDTLGSTRGFPGVPLASGKGAVNRPTWAGCLLAAGWAWTATAAGSSPGPNVVVILADDFGWGSLGCYGAPEDIKTPNLDRLAEEGRRFTQAYAPGSVCSPTRYGLLTGRYYWRTSVKDGKVLPGNGPLHIETDRLTLASLCKARGYRTAAFGKWHMGMTNGTITDWSVGRLLATLDRLGLTDDTLVIFTSDNGGIVAPGNANASRAMQAGLAINGPLRGGKHSEWEGGFRVPFLVRWPGHVPAGTTSDQMICLTDVLATIARIFHAPPPRQRRGAATRTDQLFDLGDDPAEKLDVAANHPGRALELKGALTAARQHGFTRAGAGN